MQLGTPPDSEDFKEVLLAHAKTPFQTIKLTRLSDGSHALYLDDNIQFVEGVDDDVYHGVLASLPAKMLHGKPGSVVIFGGGDGLAARNLLKYPNITKITMVEIDPEMVKFCATHPIMRALNEDAFKNPRLEVKAMDARKFVEARPKERYSIGIVDFPDPEPQFEDLFSSAFYSRALDHLNDEPIVAVQASQAYSPIEAHVTKELREATHEDAFPLRFKGRWMLNGAIVFGGAGVNPDEVRISPKWTAGLEDYDAETAVF